MSTDGAAVSFVMPICGKVLYFFGFKELKQTGITIGAFIFRRF